jgi:hypothetical protein
MILGAGKNSTIRCGVSNAASANCSAALSGTYNNVSVYNSIIGGGCKNTISYQNVYGASSILGGYQNKTYSDFQTIGGGSFNIVGGTGTLSQYGLSVIGGGGKNQIKSYGSIIGGGTGNIVCLGSNRASILGGDGNRIDVVSSCSTIGGGFKNIILGYNAKNTCSFCSTIAGGSSNYICRSKDSFIGGGGGNKNFSSNGSTIGGGLVNCNIGSVASTIGGGLGNYHYNSQFSFIGGGYKNYSSNSTTTIGGGSFNKTTQYNTTIGGGYYNRIYSVNSSILGGTGNLIPAAYPNSHIIGSNLTANAANTTFVEYLTKLGGTFSIPHPNPLLTNDFMLNHSFVESPTAGDNIYRYKILVNDKGEAGIIDLPEYFPYLNGDVQIWITPIKSFAIAYGEYDSENNRVLVFANESSEFNVLVIGTRIDSYTKTWKGAVTAKPNKSK